MQLEASVKKLPDYEAGPFIPSGVSFMCDVMKYGLPRENITFLHYHKHFEIGICREGDGIFVCNDKICAIGEGDALFVPSYARHYSKSIDPEKPCMCNFMFFDIEKILQKIGVTDKKLISKLIYESNLLHLPFLFTKTEYPTLNYALTRMFEEYHESGENGAVLCGTYFYEFMLNAQKLFPENSVKTEHIDKRVADAIKYMTIYYAENITLEKLAEECFVSKGHLLRVFKKYYGMSPIKWLNNFRLRTAQELLLKTDYSIAEICVKSGFNNPSDLYRHFVNSVGMAPAAYRAKNRK